MADRANWIILNTATHKETRPMKVVTGRVVFVAYRAVMELNYATD